MNVTKDMIDRQHLLNSRDPHAHARIDALQHTFAELFAFLAAAPPARPRPNEVQASEYRENYAYALKQFEDADKVVLHNLGLSA